MGIGHTRLGKNVTIKLDQAHVYIFHCAVTKPPDARRNTLGYGVRSQRFAEWSDTYHSTNSQVVCNNHQLFPPSTTMSKINQISSSTQFSKLLSSNSYVIADFYADWCGPCKTIAPIFEQLATSHSQPGRLAFSKVNVDSQADIARQYGVSAYVLLQDIPRESTFKDG